MSRKCSLGTKKLEVVGVKEATSWHLVAPTVVRDIDATLAKEFWQGNHAISLET